MLKADFGVAAGYSSQKMPFLIRVLSLAPKKSDKGNH